MPEVSIITPVLADSAEKVDWLIEMIESLKSQTFTDWEAVVVDDSSPASMDRAKAAADSRFRWFSMTRRSGPSLARNTGVALSVGEAILPLDADDMLADENSLQVLVDHWRGNKDKTVYGNFERWIRAAPGGHGSGFRLHRVIELADYTFERSLQSQGIAPVTALHSREAHEKAGGWSASMEFGYEDVEYLIKLGKRGICGMRIPFVTLKYRSHSESRHHRLSRISGQHDAMLDLMKNIHRDVYVEKRYPMGCCGGRGGGTTPQNNSSAIVNRSSVQQATVPPGLDQYPASDKVWVQYQARRTATFGMTGKFTNISYQVKGPGHKIQIHKNDSSIFARSGRGKDFLIGVAPPEAHQPEPEPEIQEVEIPEYNPPAPEIAEIERLDRIAADARGLDLPPADPDQPAVSEEPVIEVIPPQTQELTLDQLGIRESLQEMLAMESWTVESLAQAQPEDLMPYKGIGPTMAAKIISQALELIGG